MRKHIQLDEIGESVRRARAIAHLTQVAADQGDDMSRETSLAMCVMEDLLQGAAARIKLLAEQ